MQVNNNHSPNFGMALKINPAAADKLKGQSMEYISKLRKIGDELKNHKYVDIEITDTLKPIVRRRNCGNAYMDRFAFEKIEGNALAVKTRWASETVSADKLGSDYTAYLEFANAQEAENAYKSLKAANANLSSLDSAVEFAKLQEKSSAYKATVAAEKAKVQAKINREVEDLLKEFAQ